MSRKLFTKYMLGSKFKPASLFKVALIYWCCVQHIIQTNTCSNLLLKKEEHLPISLKLETSDLSWLQSVKSTFSLRVRTYSTLNSTRMNTNHLPFIFHVLISPLTVCIYTSRGKQSHGFAMHLLTIVIELRPSTKWE